MHIFSLWTISELLHNLQWSIRAVNQARWNNSQNQVLRLSQVVNNSKVGRCQNTTLCTLIYLSIVSEELQIINSLLPSKIKFKSQNLHAWNEQIISILNTDLIGFTRRITMKLRWLTFLLVFTFSFCTFFSQILQWNVTSSLSKQIQNNLFSINKITGNYLQLYNVCTDIVYN